MTPISDNLPNVAVLMAVANGMQWIEEQVDSIQQQKNVKIRLFISVDRSSDDSLVWCQNLAKNDDRVTLLQEGGAFGSATKNFFYLIKTVDFRQFDYVSFADQDDIWFPNKLYRACRIIEKGPYQAYSSNVTALWQNGRKKLVNKAQPKRHWDYLFEAGGPGCTYVLSTKLALRIKKTLLTNSECEKISFHDWFCYAFARAEKTPWFIDPEPSMLYRQHKKNTVGINKGWKAFIRRLKLALSGQALSQTVLTQKVVAKNLSESDLLDIPTNTRGFLKLSLKSRHCRRRLKDQIYFFGFCIAMAVISIRPEKSNL